MCAEGHWIGFRRPLCGNPRPMISAAELSSRPVPPGSLRWEIFAPASQPLLPSPLLDDLVFLPWKICPRAPTKGPPRAGRFSLWGEMGGQQDLRRSAGRVCPGGGCSLDCAAVGCFPIKAARICGWHRIFHSLRKQVFSLLVSPLRRLCQREVHPLCMPILGFFAQRINLSSHPLWVPCPRSSTSAPLWGSHSLPPPRAPFQGIPSLHFDRREGLGVLVGGFGVGSQDMETALQRLWKGEADGGVDAEFLPCWRNPTPPSHHLLPLPLLSVQSVSGWMSSPSGGQLWGCERGC